VKRWLPAIVFGVALVVRVLYLLSIRDAYFFDHLQTEPQHYDAWAGDILRGAAGVSLPFDEAPAFPYGLAAIYAIAGHSIMAACVVQALLGAGAAAAIAIVARRIAGDRAAAIAGGIAALYGPFIYFTGQLEPATLSVAACAVALVLTPVDEATPRRWWIAIAVWSAALFVRSELIVALPLVVAHAWSCLGRRRALRLALVPAGVLLVSLVANLAASGHPVLLTTGAGVNLWLGNNSHADGVDPFITRALEPTVREVEAAGSDAVEIDAGFRHRAIAFVRDDPGGAIGLGAKKLAWTFSRRELPNAMDIPWQTGQSWVFHPPWFPIGFGLVLPIAFAGAALLGREWRRYLVLAAPIAVAVVTCTATLTNARFRLVMLPALIVLAAIAIERGVAAITARDRRRIAIGACALVAGAALAWLPIAGIGRYRIAQIDVNTAVLEHGAGHLDQAERYARSALARDPDDAAGWFQLALVLEEAGKRDEATRAFAEAERLRH
jgi:4-amino-4-deoxy-L-arabinose transferase-like glycosyltransferase